MFVLTMGLALQAQETRGQEGMKRKSHHKMAFEKLNLSEEQKAQMKTENEAFRKKMAELKKEENITVKEYRSKMESFRKEHHSKMQGLLSTEQKAQMEKLKLDRKEMHMKHDKMRGERLNEKLGLSADQAEKMKKNHAELQEKIKAVKEDAKLEREAKSEKIKSLMKENHEKTKSILTEEQLKKLKEGHRPRKNKIAEKSAVI